jgi:ribosomal-protein-serine acetyltransferase
MFATARLQLEAAEPRHLDSMRAAVESSLPELRQWMAWAIEDSPETTRHFLEQAAQAWEAGTAFSFAITSQGAVIGAVGIAPYDPLSASGELGYWLASDHSGRGLTTEAAAAVVTFGFEDLGLHRLQLHAGIKNVGSQRVAEKLGFRKMGIVRDACRGEAGFYDGYIYDLLVTDPRPI